MHKSSHNFMLIRATIHNNSKCEYTPDEINKIVELFITHRAPFSVKEKILWNNNDTIAFSCTPLGMKVVYTTTMLSSEPFIFNFVCLWLHIKYITVRDENLS